jgi:membrane protein YfhO
VIPNPALPLLAVLGAAGLLAGLAGREGSVRREAGLAWGALALAGMALLAPALVLPSGIPSPAATLAQLPPWQGSGDPAAGNPLLRDVTYQIQPWQIFLRRELRAGRFPFWNPHQFSGAPFWSNGQSAPLFPLHLLFALLPLQLGFVLLPWLRLMIGGCGTWLLARELGLSRPAALLSAVTFPLSGMLVSFLLFPMGNALTLVPWVLWSVERLAAGRGGAAALAIAGGLQLLAGHPETAAHTALLSALWLLVRGPVRPFSAWLRWAGGWLAAAALAAVQILPLLRTLPETSRWRLPAAAAEPPFLLLLAQPLRLVLPQMYGHPAEGTWWGPFNYSATAVYAGALALPLAAAGLARCRGDRRWLAVAALLGFSFVAAYHWPGVRDALGALPLLGRVAHHRLLFGVELGLALLMGAGCDRWLEGKGRGLLAGAAAVALLLAAAWGLYRQDWALRGLTGVQLRWTAGAAAGAFLLALSLRWSRERRWRLWPLLPALVFCDLLLAHGGINPALPVERLYPETGAVRFLRGREGRVAGLDGALRPNAAMVYGLHDPRGDDPVKLARYERIYRTFAPADAVYFQPIRRWNGTWLDRLGVRWVLAGPAEPAPEPGWRLAYAGEDARVYERPGALPLVRWQEGAGEVRAVRREPGLWEIEWRSPKGGLLSVAETWDGGWRARVDGRSVDVVAVDRAILGVRLGPGEGRLELRYRPAGFSTGVVLSLAAALSLAFVYSSRGSDR